MDTVVAYSAADFNLVQTIQISGHTHRNPCQALTNVGARNAALAAVVVTNVSAVQASLRAVNSSLRAALAAVGTASGSGPLGSVSNPARTCRDILAARPDAITSMYT